MAVPKKKISKSRRNMRRSHHALTPTHFVFCSNCGDSKLPHHLCKRCGMYNDRQILQDKHLDA